MQKPDRLEETVQQVARITNARASNFAKFPPNGTESL
jgi:hypothetical protein